MNLSFMGFMNNMPVTNYPFSPVSHIMDTINETAPMSILEDKSRKNGTVLQADLASEMVHPVLDKRPGIFATALAHDVRNPLTNISLAAEMIGTGDLSEEQKTFIEIISRSTERINKIVTEFLNSHKAIEVEAEVCSVNTLIDEVLEMNKDRIRLKTVLIIKNYASENILIRVKRPEIKIALINVIVNAIEALPAGNGTLKLSTGSFKNKCKITIEDNGIGISENNIKKIFDPYYTNKPGGMGLGLSTTKNILSSNGGSVRVNSEMGSGSRFTFFFSKIYNS